MEDYPRTILELEERFANEDACRGYLNAMEHMVLEGAWPPPRAPTPKANPPVHASVLSPEELVVYATEGRQKKDESPLRSGGVRPRPDFDSQLRPPRKRHCPPRQSIQGMWPVFESIDRTSGDLPRSGGDPSLGEG